MNQNLARQAAAMPQQGGSTFAAQSARQKRTRNFRIDLKDHMAFAFEYEGVTKLCIRWLAPSMICAVSDTVRLQICRGNTLFDHGDLEVDLERDVITPYRFKHYFLRSEPMKELDSKRFTQGDTGVLMVHNGFFHRVFLRQDPDNVLMFAPLDRKADD